MKQIGLRCERPTFVYSEKDPTVHKKGAIVRKLRAMPLSAVLLFEDETDLKLFPEFRRAWSLRGKQAQIAITGANRKVVLFGAINVLSGHCVVQIHAKMNQQGFQDFLRSLRRCYGIRQTWLVLDEASAHTAPQIQLLAKTLNVELFWLPKQCSELNCMDHFWRQLKVDISANYQYVTIEEHAHFAVSYCLALSNRQAQRRAGILSNNFWRFI